VIDDLDNASRNGSKEQQHRAQQRHSPIGKLHNLVTYIKANNSRITLFESKQREATIDSEAEKVLRLVTNGGIR
jgi:hypothetical protein